MSSIESDAAINDLTLHKKFVDVDKVIGEKALKALERLLWYLSNLSVKVDPDIKAPCP